MPHAGYPFNVLPHPPPPAHPLKSALSYDYLSAFDEVCIKRWLSNRLRHPQSLLPRLPGGFPFHYSVNGRGQGDISYEPYEFCEEIPSDVLAGGLRRRYWVTFTFTNHTAERCRHEHRAQPPAEKSKHYMSWRAYVAVRDMSYYRSEVCNLPLLHVELDPAVLGTYYGELFKTDPTMILRAMGVSLERGLPITIKLADSSYANQILFFGTDQTGSRHLLHRFMLPLS